VKRKILLVYFVAVLATAVASADKRPAEHLISSAGTSAAPFLSTIIAGHSDPLPIQGRSVAQAGIPTKFVTTMLVSAFPIIIREENSLILVGLAFFSVGFLGLRRAQRAVTS
jgi:hypothetical protein